VVEAEEQCNVLKNVEGKTAVQKISALSDAIEGAMKYALTKTKPQDWVNQGGKYYLQATGIQRMRSVFGIYYKDLTISKEVIEGGHYAYICLGTAGSTLLNQLYGVTEITIEGIRSSKDPFFIGKDGNRDFDMMDVRKSAHANFQVRATTALLGLGGFNQDDVAKAGINIGAVSKVDYQRGGEGGGDPSVISDKQLNRLIAIQKSANVADATLKEYLEKNYKLASRTKILRKDYEAICNWCQSGGISTIDVDAEMEKSGKEKVQSWIF
jgi:hypothetical protein